MSMTTETAATETTFAELRGQVGREVGVSPWIEVDQRRINLFADVTEDHQFIHIDPERAAKTPFGTTIAHGFLTLSLLSAMSFRTLPPIAGRKMTVNYGLDKVRFLSPVPSGARVRGRFVLADFAEQNPKHATARYTITVEIEGADKPALIAESLLLTVLD